MAGAMAGEAGQAEDPSQKLSRFDKRQARSSNKCNVVLAHLSRDIEKTLGQTAASALGFVY